MRNFTYTGMKFLFILSSGVILIGLNVFNAIKPCVDAGVDNWYVVIIIGLWLGYV